MRRAIAVTSASIALSAAVACATSDDEASPPPSSDPVPSTLQEAGAPDAALPDAAPTMPSCSPGGWCITKLPDTELTLKDIWPLDDRAFAIAESPSLGVKVLEWDEAAKSWSYIDDDSQNSFEYDAYAGTIWAPSANEVYFASGPGFIYHGKRAATSSPWSWERHELPDNSNDGWPDRDHGRLEYWSRWGLPLQSIALGVWGTSADDVYAWYSNTIFHWQSVDGGAPGWVPEYIAEDPESPEDSFFIFGAGGSGSGDVWFAGGRGRFTDSSIFRCPMVVRKSAGAYERLVDTMIDPTDVWSHYDDTCVEKKDVLAFSWSDGRTETMHWGHGGWMTSIASAGAGRVAGIVGEHLFAYVEAGSSPVARVNQVVAQVPRDILPSVVSSVSTLGDETWLSGWGLVLRTPIDTKRWSTGLGLMSEDRAKQVGLDAATYEISSTAMNGAPLDEPLYQVRGTSNTNLWAIGREHALHKTTP